MTGRAETDAEARLAEVLAEAARDFLAACEKWPTGLELAAALLPVVREIADQRAAVMLRAAADWIWDEAPALASASAELHARADDLDRAALRGEAGR